jgi:hypothetical protein
VAMQQQQAAAGVNDKHATCLPADGPARSHDAHITELAVRPEVAHMLGQPPAGLPHAGQSHDGQ